MKKIIFLVFIVLNLYASDSSNKITPLGWAIINNGGKNNAENNI